MRNWFYVDLVYKERIYSVGDVYIIDKNNRVDGEKVSESDKVCVSFIKMFFYCICDICINIFCRKDEVC